MILLPLIRVFPDSETLYDKEFRAACKRLQRVGFKQLEIPEHFQLQEIWDLIGTSKIIAHQYQTKNIIKFHQELNFIDHQIRVFDKLNILLECFRMVSDSCEMASQGATASADVIFSVLVYVVLRACPRRFSSNLK